MQPWRHRPRAHTSTQVPYVVVYLMFCCMYTPSETTKRKGKGLKIDEPAWKSKTPLMNQVVRYRCTVCFPSTPLVLLQA